jgi:hypothetical protein
MIRFRRCYREPFCAPTLAAIALGLFAAAAPASYGQSWEARAVRVTDQPVYVTETPSTQSAVWAGYVAAGSEAPVLSNTLPQGEAWIMPPGEALPVEGMPPADGVWIQPPMQEPVFYEASPSSKWSWQILPDTIIYHSYWAGVHEPRMSLVLFEERDGRPLWDATLGGRLGLLRYGDMDCYRPQGWQLDFEGAAIMRFTLDRERDFETADYRAGVPLTYGIGDWQFKFGYYHLSSHMGDEFALRNGALGDRINYVRDALVLGASYYPHPVVRLYSEAAYALKIDGGADRWEFQFGTELSRPGPTGLRGTPFFAANAHLREEHDFGGDVTGQIGWLWRGREQQVMRVGFHYFNGKSSQYQTFDDSEEQIGFGVWYDF